MTGSKFIKVHNAQFSVRMSQLSKGHGKWIKT